MKLEVYANPESVAQKAAEYIAAEARAAVAARGRFMLAVSGGRTPWMMLRELADEDVPWKKTQIVQVDERIAPEGDPDRNLTHLHESLLEHTPLTREQIHAMPVNQADLEKAASDYAQTLRTIAGSPPVIDLVHLGMGPDGHTASLIPNDPVLNVSDVDVAITGLYQNRRRMTLTYPTINRARKILWLVTGSDKVVMLPRLLTADPSIPAGRVSQERATLFADQAAYPQGASK
ncbi:MAG TPA: 6-phosphogluconolactonase [Gemmatales bacterium]|nr:6-phosphogluconolactonase [Gemmatales bacterium]